VLNEPEFRSYRRQARDLRTQSVVASAGVDPTLIELEITESYLMQDPAHAIRVMRDAGIRIAIDDFGTGYSSLAYLTRPSCAPIIEMAHTLGFTVIAEGVETEEQAASLRLLRCEQAQGFLFARPMPAEEFARFCASHRNASGIP
jgi:EAL domain-containing protein (putative c-di-GMP-specific phosphodiesterase class I)